MSRKAEIIKNKLDNITESLGIEEARVETISSAVEEMFGGSILADIELDDEIPSQHLLLIQTMLDDFKDSRDTIKETLIKAKRLLDIALEQIEIDPENIKLLQISSELINSTNRNAEDLYKLYQNLVGTVSKINSMNKKENPDSDSGKMQIQNANIILAGNFHDIKNLNKGN